VTRIRKSASVFLRRARQLRQRLATFGVAEGSVGREEIGVRVSIVCVRIDGVAVAGDQLLNLDVISGGE
jgi:hypothetical protein